jgi:hypothetical protein
MFCGLERQSSEARSHLSTRGIALAAVAIASIALVGCGEQIDPTRLAVFPAKGQISFKGQAPVGASIVLFPKTTAPKGSDAPLVCPRGRVQTDGTFALTSYKADDGAPAGEYSVTLEWHKLVKAPDGQPDLGPNLLPAQFSRPEKSPLVVKIAAGTNTLPPIVLK